jgi:hypothetical protein
MIFEVIQCQYWLLSRGYMGSVWLRAYSGGELVFERLSTPYKYFFDSFNLLIPLHKVTDIHGIEREPFWEYIENTFDQMKSLMEFSFFNKTLGYYIAAYHSGWLDDGIIMLMLVIDRVHSYVLSSSEKASPVVSSNHTALLSKIQHACPELENKVRKALTPGFASFYSHLKAILEKYLIAESAASITNLETLSRLRNSFMHGQELPEEVEKLLPVIEEELRHVVDLILLSAVGYTGAYRNFHTRQKIAWVR